MAKKVKLPYKPSKLLTIALKDLQKVEKLKKDYRIDMWDYHQASYSSSDTCSVCLAGAVMARTLKTPKTKTVHPEVFGDHNHYALRAIDLFRMGECDTAFEYLGIHDDLYRLSGSDRFNREMPEYKGKGVRFKNAIKKLIGDLKKAGF
jgi:hypothetical protein